MHLLPLQSALKRIRGAHPHPAYPGNLQRLQEGDAEQIWRALLDQGNEPVVRHYVQETLGEMPTINHLIWLALTLTPHLKVMQRRLRRCGFDVELVESGCSGSKSIPALLIEPSGILLWKADWREDWWRYQECDGGSVGSESIVEDGVLCFSILAPAAFAEGLRVAQIATLSKPTRLIKVSLCCNDPESGDFAGCLRLLEVGRLLLAEPRNNVVPSLKIEKDWLQVGEQHYPHRKHLGWGGNWAWDDVWLNLDQLARLLNQLRTEFGWSVDNCSSRIHKAWGAEALITAQDLEVWLDEDDGAAWLEEPERRAV